MCSTTSNKRAPQNWIKHVKIYLSLVQKSRDGPCDASRVLVLFRLHSLWCIGFTIMLLDVWSLSDSQQAFRAVWRGNSVVWLVWSWNHFVPITEILSLDISHCHMSCSHLELQAKYKKMGILFCHFVRLDGGKDLDRQLPVSHKSLWINVGVDAFLIFEN